MSKVSFETLKAAEHGRSLVSETLAFELQASIITAADGRELLAIRAAAPSPSGAAHSRCTQIVMNSNLQIIANATAEQPREAWVEISKALAAIGVDIATVRPLKDGVNPPFFDPEYRGRSNSDLKAWLRYWDDDPCARDEADAIGTTTYAEADKLRAELRARGADG